MKAKEQAFVWADDEVELLLKVTHKYKVKKAGKSVDWESVRSKYSDIWEQLKQQLPSDSEVELPSRAMRTAMHIVI